MSAAQQGPAMNRSSSLTRRSAVTGALAAAGLLATARTASAQDATPGADDVSYLFLQACESGVATSTTGGEGTYELVLQHASGQTLFFSDRPERVAGIVETDAFLEEIASVVDDPPNAALAFSPEGSSDEVEVAVVELTSPRFDAEAGTITYRARLIGVEDARQGDAAAGETVVPVTELPASFGQATVFIDDMGGASLPLIALQFRRTT